VFAHGWVTGVATPTSTRWLGSPRTLGKAIVGVVGGFGAGTVKATSPTGGLRPALTAPGGHPVLTHSSKDPRLTARRT
jgi:hypothetical protein